SRFKRPLACGQEGSPLVGCIRVNPAACPDNGTIDAPQVVVDFILVIEFVEQRSNEADPDTGFTPAVEELKDRLPGALAFREITPGGAGMQDPQDAVEQRSRIVEGTARLMVVRAMWQQRGNPGPLSVRELIAAHGRTRWGPRLTRSLHPTFYSSATQSVFLV